MKLTKKQSEIVNKIKEIQQQTGETVYLMYQEFSKKIHAVTIVKNENDKILKFNNHGILCTHGVASTMENKSIILPEVVGQSKRCLNENKLYDFTLCKVNPVLT